MRSKGPRYRLERGVVSEVKDGGVFDIFMWRG